jgi:ubiquinone/menaquinone biosynthesis C-methylase UbiE
MEELNLRDFSIVDAIPVRCKDCVIINVGCGEGRIDRHLAKMGFFVFATDIKMHDSWNKGEKQQNIRYRVSDIFDLESFPVTNAPIIICSEVLEHLFYYKKAIENLILLATSRIIITVPFKNSYMSHDHCNFWNDETIKEFHEICRPYSVSIMKTVSKPRDTVMKQASFTIVVDMIQKHDAISIVR